MEEKKTENKGRLQCPQCGALLEDGKTVCVCGYAHLYTDYELGNMLEFYGKEEEKGSRIILLSGGIMALGMMMGIAIGKLLFALPFLLIGALMIIMGGRKSRRSNEMKNQLIYEQIGPYAQKQYEEMIGDFQVITDKKEAGKFMENSQLLPAWNTFEGSNFIQGYFDNIPYTIGNASLRYEQRGLGSGEDLDQDIYRFPVLEGIWLQLDLTHSLIRNPIYIREVCLDERPKYKHVRENESFGKDELAGLIKLGHSSFDEIFHSYCSDEDQLLSFLTKDRIEKIMEIRRLADGPLCLEIHKDFCNLAINTPFSVYSFDTGQNMQTIHAMKQGFMINLQYQYKIFRCMKEF